MHIHSCVRVCIILFIRVYVYVLVYVLLGCVALGAQRPIAIELSRRRSVGLSMRLPVRRSVQCIVENAGSDPDAVWHHRSGRWVQGLGW